MKGRIFVPVSNGVLMDIKVPLTLKDIPVIPPRTIRDVLKERPTAYELKAQIYQETLPEPKTPT